MGDWKLPSWLRRGGAVTAALGGAALVAGCAAAAAATPSPGPGDATPTVTPVAVPVLGAMKLGAFPNTADGVAALTVCEQWAGLRGDYVTALRHDSAFQLEQWFSSTSWLPAFAANSPLKTDPRYTYISTAFGLVTEPDAASLDTARHLDKACAEAD